MDDNHDKPAAEAAEHRGEMSKPTPSAAMTNEDSNADATSSAARLVSQLEMLAQSNRREALDNERSLDELSDRVTEAAHQVALSVRESITASSDLVYASVLFREVPLLHALRDGLRETNIYGYHKDFHDFALLERVHMQIEEVVIRSLKQLCEAPAVNTNRFKTLVTFFLRFKMSRARYDMRKSRLDLMMQKKRCAFLRAKSLQEECAMIGTLFKISDLVQTEPYDEDNVAALALLKYGLESLTTKKPKPKEASNTAKAEDEAGNTQQVST